MVNPDRVTSFKSKRMRTKVEFKKKEVTCFLFKCAKKTRCEQCFDKFRSYLQNV